MNVLRPAIGLVLVASVAHADVSVVENPATPPQGRVTVSPTEMWRVGGQDEDYLFGVVESAAVDAQGVTYLLDSQLNEITAIDTKGVRVGAFGRQGEGPGEMQQPRAILVLPGDRIGVVDSRPPKLIHYSPQGDPLGDTSLIGNEGLNFAMDAQGGGGRVVVQLAITSFNETKQTSVNALRAFDATTGSELFDYVSVEHERDRLGGGGGRMVVMLGSEDFVDDWALAGDGTLYAVRDDGVYEIEVYDAQGTHVRTIRRAGERVARPQAHVDADIAERTSMSERFGMPFDSDEVETMEPHVAGLIPRPDGHLWVLTGTGLAHDDPEMVGVFDEFDPQGRFVRQVELRAPFDRAQDEMSLFGEALIVYQDVQAARGSGVVIMGSTIAPAEEEESDAEPLAIVRYRL